MEDREKLLMNYSLKDAFVWINPDTDQSMSARRVLIKSGWVHQLIWLILLIPLLTTITAFGQENSSVKQLIHENRMYIADDGKLYIAQSLPIYLHISTSRQITGESYLLKDNKANEQAKPMYLSEGKNTISNPMTIDPNTKSVLNAKGQYYEVYGDGTAPYTEVAFSGATRYDNEKNSFFGPGLLYTLIAADALSGVQETYLSVNGTAFKPDREISIDLKVDSKYNFQYYTIDNVGNVEKIRGIKFFIDVTPPKTVLEFIGDYNQNILSPTATIALIGQDNLSGVKSIFFQIDDIKKQKYKNNISVSELSVGEHTIIYYAEDNVGNIEEQHSYIFYYDPIPPEIIISVISDQYTTEHTVFISNNTQFKLEAFDNRANIEKIQYQIDQNAIQIYSKLFNLPKEGGIHRIRYFATDSVQNRSADLIQKVYMDFIPPETVYELIGSTFWNRDTLILTKDVRISLLSTDMEAGVQEIKYRVNSGKYSIYKEPLSFTKDVTYKLDYFAADRVNNIEEQQTLWIRSDNTVVDKIQRQQRVVTQQLKHPKQWIETETFGLVGSTELPFYLRISASPEDTAASFLLDMSTVIPNDSTPLHFDQHGSNSITMKVTSTTGKFRVNIDGEPPKTVAMFQQAEKAVRGKNTYYGPDLIINLIADDNKTGVRSGLLKTYFSIDGSEFGTFRKPIDIFSAEKFYQIHYYSVDSVGNVENVNEIEFFIDLTPPWSKQTIEGTYFGNMLSSKSIISLESNDNLSGVRHIYYNFDDTQKKVYKNRFSSKDFRRISEGNHIIYYYSIDHVGNEEKIKSFPFYLDHSPPDVVFKIFKDAYEKDDQLFVSQRSRIRLSAADKKTTVKAIQYQINKEPFTTYKTEFGLPGTGGNYLISFFGIDMVDNVSDRENKTLYLDLTSPKSNIHFEGPIFITGGQLYISSRTEIVLASSDGESGVQEIQYKIGRNKTKVYTKPFKIYSNGRNEVSYQALDYVNNKEELHKMTVFVDNQSPEINIAYNSVSKKRLKNIGKKIPVNASIYLSADDALTGRERIVYSINDGEEKLYRTPLSNFKRGQIMKMKVVAIDQVANRSEKLITFTVEATEP